MARQLGGFKDWPAQHIGLSTARVVEMYQNGFAGAWFDPEAKDEFRQSIIDGGGDVNGEAVAYRSGLVGSGAGKLSIPFIHAYQHWPKMWPCPGQTTGDCVSHAGKNSALVLIGVECILGEPDPETGVVEGWPEVSTEAEEQGVVACENIYRARGHSGQGASCSTLQKYVTTKGGILLRQNYPELGIDLTRYNASLGIPGSKGVPEPWSVEGAKHRIRTATECSNHEQARDFIANGYPIWVCSSLGWSSTRDENGYSKQQGGWGHSWVADGYDDRPEIIQKYGFPLFHYNHDWHLWNRGGRRIFGTTIDIPEGSFWGDARLLDRCDLTAMASMNGWKPRNLPDYRMRWN